MQKTGNERRQEPSLVFIYKWFYRDMADSIPAFDKLSNDSVDNPAFGIAQADCAHFSKSATKALLTLREEFSREYAEYCGSYKEVSLCPGL